MLVKDFLELMLSKKQIKEIIDVKDHSQEVTVVEDMDKDIEKYLYYNVLIFTVLVKTTSPKYIDGDIFADVLQMKAGIKLYVSNQK